MVTPDAGSVIVLVSKVSVVRDVSSARDSGSVVRLALSVTENRKVSDDGGETITLRLTMERIQARELADLRRQTRQRVLMSCKRCTVRTLDKTTNARKPRISNITPPFHLTIEMSQARELPKFGR
jgi:hypothetical protein